MANLISYGSYVPHFRLRRAAIAASLGTSPRDGSRSVASYDEDTTSMGVEAARAALSVAPEGAIEPKRILFATADPPYLDKTNATAIHAALDLPADAFAGDMIGSVRSGIAAIRAAVDSPAPTLAVASDIRGGLPGGTDEADGGDAAAALLFGDGPAIAEYLGATSVTGEFLDRWRTPGEPNSRVWEERFGEQAYRPLVERALIGMKESGVPADAIDHLIVTGLHARAVRGAIRAAGVRGDAVVDDLVGQVGNTGVAHPALLLASVLDRAEPDQVIALVVLADGCDILLFRTTDQLPSSRPRTTVAEQIASGDDGLDYPSFLTWRGLLRREPPRRPDLEPPAAPPSFRHEPWKFAFTGSRCTACGTRHLPPHRVCMNCHAVDRMDPERLADAQGTITTFTLDRVSFSLNPPIVVGVINFDGGGRYQCELTDVAAGGVEIGDRVEMTFRRMFTANGVHNYFWKARPVRGGQ